MATRRSLNCGVHMQSRGWGSGFVLQWFLMEAGGDGLQKGATGAVEAQGMEAGVVEEAGEGVHGSVGLTHRSGCHAEY